MSEGAPRIEPFEIEGAAGRPIRGEARLVNGATASVVVLHGFKGFFRFSFFPYVAEQIAAAGMNVISFNFSGSGVGPDLESFTDSEAFFDNSFAREMYDVVRVASASDDRGWLGARYGVLGHSRGGGIAVLHAADNLRVGALVTWAGISTVRRWSDVVMTAWRDRGHTEIANSRTGQVLKLGTRVLDEAVDHGSARLDIRRAGREVKSPWLIVHGDADETVPIAEAEALRAASRERAEVLRIPGATHSFNVSHGSSVRSPELITATERTVAFFTDSLLGAE